MTGLSSFGLLSAKVFCMTTDKLGSSSFRNLEAQNVFSSSSLGMTVEANLYPNVSVRG